MIIAHARHAGVTLVEMLVVISTVAVVLISIMTISLQFSRIYRHTNAMLVPQSDQLLALRKMERELREAYSLEPTSNATSLEINPPKKTTGTTRVIDAQQSTDGSLTPLPESYTIRYFLGTFVDGEARPNANGDTIFRVQSTDTQDAAGNYPLPGSADKYIIVRNLAPLDGASLFSYEPGGAAPTNKTRLVIVTLNTPVRESEGGNPFTYQRLTTQFALRNLQGR